ncbi:MAG: tagaturonate epimerase family protein [Planctomycetota bacterium]
MSRINDFLLANDIRIATNPAISPDYCLDWPACAQRLQAGDLLDFDQFPASTLQLGGSQLRVAVEPETGDHVYIVTGDALELEQHLALGADSHAYPCTWANLLKLKNLIQENDPEATVFPTASGSLARQSLGIGARFTALHWPAVDWAMAKLGISLTANQNSIPRELVYDVEPMLDDQLDTCRFPFIGADVPEGHQGQSVEGMSHGAVLTKLKYGFHQHRLPWGFNADHQPVGGKYDAREDALVRGGLLATYITFDLSPELLATTVPDDEQAITERYDRIPTDIVTITRERVLAAGVELDDAAFRRLLVGVWPAMRKMKARDDKYAAARAAAFSTDIGRAYFRELSIDELPGLTTPETLATMLALAEAMGMPADFVAPAFGFQKNFPFDDNSELRRRIDAAWQVCRSFDVSIGFHSGSGKSAENYRICGEITGSRLEIKTSGRYTYEMGVALCQSENEADQALWRDWYDFTRELALTSAFAPDQTEQEMARSFIAHALEREGRSHDVFATPETARQALSELEPSPDHMFWFEYNFLYVLAAEGSPDKSRLGDHGPAGCRQRARFYAISGKGKLAYSRRVADYICFLAEHTGLAPAGRCAQVRKQLEGFCCYRALLADIAPQ